MSQYFRYRNLQDMFKDAILHPLTLLDPHRTNGYMLHQDDTGALIWEQADPPPKLKSPYLVLPVTVSRLHTPTCPCCGQSAPHIYLANTPQHVVAGFVNIAGITKLHLTR